jgi:hypothetical protein
MTALAEARALGVEFGTQLANHAAMVLHAQRRLGGTEADARRFLDAYLAKTGLASMRPSPGTVTRATWASHLGDRDFEAAHRAFFRAELARLGSAEALQREWLPRLLPGMAASALHALMRLAYANDAGDAGEAAEALGYWSACYLPLGEGVGAPPVTAEPAEVLLRVAALPELRRTKPPSELLWHHMRAVAAEPAFAPVHDWLAVGPQTLDRIARDSLLVFAATMEFCALHAVTGAHWLRLVLPALGPADQARAIRHFWQAIASVYPKMGCPLPLTAAEAARQRALPCPGWEEIAAVACRSDDEHDVSLVWSAREEHAHRGDRLYQVVAARRVGLLTV